MRHRKSLRELVLTSSRIETSDWSDYESGKSYDGGQYGFGQHWRRIGVNAWHCQEWTTGDFCPHCRSFFCCGSCRAAEIDETAVYTDAEVLKEVRRARRSGDELEFFY